MYKKTRDTAIPIKTFYGDYERDSIYAPKVRYWNTKALNVVREGIEQNLTNKQIRENLHEVTGLWYSMQKIYDRRKKITSGE